MANTDIIIHDKKDNAGVVVMITPNQDCDFWIMKMTILQKFNLKMKFH